jgi:RNA 3'-terminal phosphate cyclase (ATP)
MIEIDGSYGEGGGQILRTSLALSLVTRKSFMIKNVRAGRREPGLLNQHVTAVNAAAEIGNAIVSGNVLRSRQISFEPKGIKPGRYQFRVGTAGSCTLILQTILPALMIAESGSELALEGGTHNPFAPPFDFLDRVFLPILSQMGPRVEAGLKRWGFYPSGGGRIDVSIKPCATLSGIELIKRGKIKRILSRAIVSRLPSDIARRELEVVRKELGLENRTIEMLKLTTAYGPGNVLIIEIQSENITELFVGFGRKAKSTEQIAGGVVDKAKEYISSEAPVGKYLADQLLTPMAVAGAGKFRTMALTDHATTNIEIIKRFLDVKINISPIEKNVFEVKFGN